MLDLQRAVRLGQMLHGERLIRLEFAAALLLGVGLAVLTAHQLASASTMDVQGLLLLSSLLAFFIGLAINDAVLLWLSRGSLRQLARFDARRELRSIHEKEMRKMSVSTITSKRASALLLKRDLLMKLKLIGYWVATAAFALVMVVAAIGELFPADDIVQIRVQEGYLAYLLTILGVWKLLGVIALLVPGFPRLKEWAYAGFFFDLTGAAGIASGGAGDPGTAILLPIILIPIELASWALRPSSRTLGVLFPRRQLA